MDTAKIFNSISIESKDFYIDYGYAHYRIVSDVFYSNIDSCFDYYSDDNIEQQQNVAFKNADGDPRHYVDIFRDPHSKSYLIYKDNKISKIIKNHLSSSNRFIFTHSKMSFKQIGVDTDWYPHQDHGYNFEKNVRDGFAIFICLEDMDEDNGCLQIYPESHLLGPLSHDRQIENIESGDNQRLINQIPDSMIPVSIIAKKGDVIIFSPTTIHSSQSSKTKSKRLSLIAEIQEFKTLTLDDYGKIPIFIIGSINTFERFTLNLRKIFSLQIYWNILKSNKKLSAFIRKLLYKYE
tara:strand:+ start:1144 stop:2022 length:879 start_codon:yes stop_codon:yes gene_type:complete